METFLSLAYDHNITSDMTINSELKLQTPKARGITAFDMLKSGKVENEICFLFGCEVNRERGQISVEPGLNRILTATQVEHTIIDISSSQDIRKQQHFAQSLQQAAELRTKTLSVQPENICR